MEEEYPKKVESEIPSVPTTPTQEDHFAIINKKEEEGTDRNDIDLKKIVNPLPAEEKVAPVIHQKIVESHKGTNAEGPINRDDELARVETEKKLALIKAWEESEKSRAENKAYKKLSAVAAWENSKKASVEAQLKKIEEKLERKKAESAEKMKNKMAEVHKAAEEKRAMVEAKRREQFLNVEETASKFRASGYSPRKLFTCFSS